MDINKIFSSESEVGVSAKPPRMIPKWVFPTVAVFIIIVMLLSGIFIGLGINNVSVDAKNMSKDMPMLEEIYALINKYYYKDISWSQLQEQAAAGLANIDQFSWLSIYETEASPSMGINMKFSKYNESYVSRVIQESPADKSRGNLVDIAINYKTKAVTVSELSTVNDQRIERGDKVIAFKSELDDKYTFTEYFGGTGVQNLVGANDAFSMILLKPNGSHYQIKIVKEFFNTQVGKYTSLGNGVGCIDLYSFDYESIDNIFSLFGEFINDRSATKLIFNMNDNGGGDARVLQEITTFLVPYTKHNKLEIIKVDGKNPETYYATESTRNGVTNSYLGNVKKDFELALLVNSKSASASEALMGVVQTYNPSAFTIGSGTFGKGVTQTVINLKNGKYAVSIVSGYFYVPRYNSDGKLVWETHHGKPMMPEYDISKEPGYDTMYASKLDELDVKKAMELFNS